MYIQIIFFRSIPLINNVIKYDTLFHSYWFLLLIVRRSYRSFHFSNLDGGIVDLPPERPRGSNAVNALNRFSQNNDPGMNQRLEDNARAGAMATMNIASRLVLSVHYQTWHLILFNIDQQFIHGMNQPELSVNGVFEICLPVQMSMTFQHYV